ncbi:hypothetical protein Q0812_13225 [Brevundimonas sp. 2R-24]|uniref:Uncharacterized protein n=1 Tax=Peiella sedimenti TaxID=3061083 RepID=A0ABT8SQ62_9CAUL|nr:hypothetical protein [Caulobacteraceae bacterium XZ-24]
MRTYTLTHDQMMDLWAAVQTGKMMCEEGAVLWSSSPALVEINQRRGARIGAAERTVEAVMGPQNKAAA